MLAISLTLQSREASTDQSWNAVIFPCSINIVQSCLSTPEHQQLLLFLLGIHHRHLYTHSTIFTILTQDSKADGGYLFYTELSIYYGTKELATSSQFCLWMTKQALCGNVLKNCIRWLADAWVRSGELCERVSANSVAKVQRLVSRVYEQLDTAMSTERFVSNW